MDDPIFAAAAGGGGEGGSTFNFQCCGSFLYKVSVNEALYHLMVLHQNHLTPPSYLSGGYPRLPASLYSATNWQNDVQTQPRHLLRLPPLNPDPRTDYYSTFAPNLPLANFGH